MPPPTTEIAHLPLLPGIDLHNESSDAGKIWQEALATIAAQDGYLRASWGVQEEAKDTLVLLIGTPSIPRLISTHLKPPHRDSRLDHPLLPPPLHP